MKVTVFFISILLSLNVFSEEYVCSFQLKNSIGMEFIERNGNHFIISDGVEPGTRMEILKETNNFLTLVNADEIVSFDQSILLYILDKKSLTVSSWFLQTIVKRDETRQTNGSCILRND
tara:strand:+ start:335 stop:691 length:357 start_codon:yes stop_codon:yes gene_type:complete